jgi:hypothetical protein
MVSKKKYQLYQLFILYWAQNPHSNGASILYRHVIQKPHEEEEEEEEEEKIKEEQIVVQQEEQEQQHQVQQSLVLKLRQEQEEEIIKPYSFLDGYTPPNLLSQALSNSSDDDDSVRSNQLNIPSPQQQQKEVT